MNCSLGDAFADNGFSFVEKLHSPIFLIHKSGHLKNVNEAGRKLLAIARIDWDKMKQVAGLWTGENQVGGATESRRIKSRYKEMKLIIKPLVSSDYYIAELIR